MEENNQVKRVFLDLVSSFAEKKLDNADEYVSPIVTARISGLGECSSWLLLKYLLNTKAAFMKDISCRIGNYVAVIKEGRAVQTAGVMIKFKDDTGSEQAIAGIFLAKYIKKDEWMIWDISFEIVDRIQKTKSLVGWYHGVPLPPISGEYDVSCLVGENRINFGEEKKIVEYLFTMFNFMIGTHTYYLARKIFTRDAIVKIKPLNKEISIREAINTWKLLYPLSEFKNYPLCHEIRVDLKEQGIHAYVFAETLDYKEYKYYLEIVHRNNDWKIKSIIQGGY